MKKSAYLIIISVLTIAAIVFGTMFHTRSIKFGDVRHWINLGKSISSDSDWGYDDAEYSSNKVDGNISENLSAFKKIKIDADVMEISIVNADNFGLECSYNREYMKPNFEIKDDTLRITQNIPKRMKGNNNAKSVIYIPRFTSLEGIDIDINVGEISIHDVEGKTCEVKNNVGEITLDKITFDNIEVKTNVGEIDINLLNDISEYSIDVATDVGAVTVDGKNYKKRFESKGSTKKTIEAKSNVGEITLR